MKKRTILPLILLLSILSSYSVKSQNFLWGRSGGSSDPGEETIDDIATDRNGNVYILSTVKKQSLNIAGQPLVGWGDSDVMLASFAPDGTLRWTKLIGAGGTDRAYHLGTDAKDGVYFSAVVSQHNGPVAIDKDGWTVKNFQCLLLVKYDTAGNFKWYRQPQPDSLTSGASWQGTSLIGLDVDEAGTTYWLVRLPPGGYANGALNVTTTGVYILKYNSSGAFSYAKADMEVDVDGSNGHNLTFDNVNNRVILSGKIGSIGNLAIGGDLLKNASYIAIFKTDGKLLWKKTGTCAFNSRAAIDANGNIYLAGGAKGHSSTSPASQFNGYTANNGERGGPFITKMDKNGNHLWSKAGEGKQAASGALCVGLRGKEVMIAGTYAGTLEWSGYPYSGFLNSDNYDVFTTRFDTSNGYVLGMDRIASTTGSYEYGECMATDEKGNIYIGGNFGGDMLVNANEKLQSTMGSIDWCLLKYGDMWPVSVEHTTPATIKVFPNPATDKIAVEGVEVGSRISIVNMLGQEMYQGVVDSTRKWIDIDDLVQGNYLLQSTSRDGSKNIIKLVKYQ